MARLFSILKRVSEATGDDIGHLREVARQLQRCEKPVLIPKLSRGKRIRVDEEHVARLLIGMCAPQLNQAPEFVLSRSALIPINVYRKSHSKAQESWTTIKLNDEQTEYLLGPRASLFEYLHNLLDRRKERANALLGLHSFNIYQSGPVAMVRHEYDRDDGNDPVQYEVWYGPFGKPASQPASDGQRAITSHAILPGKVVRLCCDILDELDEDEILARYEASKNTETILGEATGAIE